MLTQYQSSIDLATPQRGEVKDFLLGFDDLKKRAESGIPSAQLMLGLSFRLGLRECIINEEEGRKWIAIAAKSGDSPAGLCAQGICYDLGIGGVVIKNPDKAKELYSQASEQGYIPAMERLALRIYQESITTITSTSSNSEGTTTHKTTQADQEKLKGVVSLCLVGAEADYAPAQNLLGVCYENGYGVKEDTKESFKLYKMAAESGSALAKKNVGMSYKNGNGVRKDSSEARVWLRAAKEQGREDVDKYLKRCVIL